MDRIVGDQDKKPYLTDRQHSLQPLNIPAFMTSEHKQSLLHFLLRINMYVKPHSEDMTVGFVYGFTVSAAGSCYFESILEDYLSDELNIARRADGWPGQIRRYAQKRELSWLCVFRRAAMEVLLREDHDGVKIPFVRDRIVAGILSAQYDHTRAEDWLEHWKPFARESMTGSGTCGQPVNTGFWKRSTAWCAKSRLSRQDKSRGACCASW